jgi:predicted nucleic acid-binding protein
MPELFADTSGWGSLVDSTQPFHTLAASIYRTSAARSERIVTTNYVLTEVVALLTSPLRIPRATIVAFIDAVKSSPFVEVAHIDAVLDQDAWQLLQNRQDKDWSLVDCASFVFMQRRGMTNALTTDHHFEQAGFIRLLK